MMYYDMIYDYSNDDYDDLKKKIYNTWACRNKDRNNWFIWAVDWKLNKKLFISETNWTRKLSEHILFVDTEVFSEHPVKISLSNAERSIFLFSSYPVAPFFSPWNRSSCGVA